MIQTIMDLPGNCTGCGACYSICEAKAILYNQNQLGFYEATIDQNRCIHCGKCSKVCIKNPNIVTEHHINQASQVYAAQSKDSEVIKKSTSGGIAYELAKFALSVGFKVVGTVYNASKQIAELRIASDPQQLNELQGSKYLQGYSAEVYQTVIEQVKGDPSSKYVIFGTPCQIYGISKAAKLCHVRDRIILVDLFCHGVPTYHLWSKYLNETEKKSRTHATMNEVAFRDKKYGWNVYTLRLANADKQLYTTSDRSLFYKIYFDHIALNKACCDCKVRMGETEADIRLGDYWGPRYSDHTDGVSAVLLVTKVGKSFIQQMKRHIKILDKQDVLDCMRYQSMNLYPVDEKQRELFYQLLQEQQSLAKIKNKYRRLFPWKKRLKLWGKDLMSFLPVTLKSSMKRLWVIKNDKGRKHEDGY